MNTRDRMLMVIVLWIVVIPILMMAMVVPMLPSEIIDIVVIPGVEPNYASKYNNYYAIFTTLIPMLIVIVAAFYKDRGHEGKNFMSILFTAILLTVCIFALLLFGVQQQIKVASVDPTKFNYLNLLWIGMTFITSLIGVFLPNLKMNEFIGFKNNKTLSNPYVWATVHRTAWKVVCIGAIVAGVGSSFASSWYGGIVLLVYVGAIAIWAVAYSSVVAKRVQRDEAAELLDSFTPIVRVTEKVESNGSLKEPSAERTNEAMTKENGAEEENDQTIKTMRNSETTESANDTETETTSDKKDDCENGAEEENDQAIKTVRNSETTEGANDTVTETTSEKKDRATTKTARKNTTKQ